MPPDLLGALAAQAMQGDLLVVEGAMGLFDGVPAPAGRSGAGADVAARLGLPVLLVLDVSGQSQSAAAIARGFQLHAPDVRIAGLVLNRIGSARHERLIRDAMAPLGLPVVGAIPRSDALSLPSDISGWSRPASMAICPHGSQPSRGHGRAPSRLDAIIALADDTAPPSGRAQHLPPPGQRVALARDEAFSFLYGHLLSAWRAAGAEIVPFSPLADEAPAEDCDACWLPGGYPELHAAGSRRRRGSSPPSRFCANPPGHGECGGYMALGSVLVDGAGETHAMAGLLALETSFAKRKMTLGYREARLLAPSPSVCLGRGYAA